MTNMYNEFPSWPTMEQHFAILAFNSIRPKLSFVVNRIAALRTVRQSDYDAL